MTTTLALAWAALPLLPYPYERWPASFGALWILGMSIMLWCLILSAV